jgi:hypothetical protein
MSEMEPLIGGIAPSPEPAPVRRTMSEEHKARMAAGRAAKAQSRARPASRPEPSPLPKERPQGFAGDQSLEDIIDALGTGEHLTRERRGDGGGGLDVPLQGRREGWDYQWWATHVVGQEVDPSYTVEITRGSWFPVPASHFPQLCPPGWSRPTIDRQGLRLYMRPMRLTKEAQAEANRFAYEQKQARLQAAQAGETGSDYAKRVQLEGITVKTEPLLP